MRPALSDYRHLTSGKVRDLYRIDDDHLLFVASDRISAYDYVLDSQIPDKGRVLTAMSVFFFDYLAEQIGALNHLAGPPDDPRIPDEVLGVDADVDAGEDDDADLLVVARAADRLFVAAHLQRDPRGADLVARANQAGGEQVTGIRFRQGVDWRADRTVGHSLDPSPHGGDWADVEELRGHAAAASSRG